MNIVRPEPVIKRPPEAEKVFTGKIYNVYHWQQELFDGSHTTFETLQRPDTVEIIPILPSGKIVLIREQQPGVKEFIGFPGGRVDQGEAPFLAAQRELEEETGLRSEDWELLKAQQLLEKIDWAIFILVARNCQESQDSHTEAGEHISRFEVSFRDLLDIALEPNFRDPEIARIILEARIDETKMRNLKELFRQV